MSARPAPHSADSPPPQPAQEASADAPRRARRKQARPGELLEAALDLFVEKGYAATRVEEVAARAGVSKGTLFLYFPSKEELFKAVVRECIVGRFEEWSAQLAAFTGPTSELLRICYHLWWERIGNTRASGITKLMLCEAGNFPELAEFYQAEVVQPANALIYGILERGVARGEFRRVDLPYTAYTVIAPLLFLMLNKHSMSACIPKGQDFDPMAFIEQQVALLLQGLCLPTPIPPRTAKKT